MNERGVVKQNASARSKTWSASRMRGIDIHNSRYRSRYAFWEKGILAMTFYLRFGVLLIIGLLTFPIAIAQAEPTTDPLVKVLVTKGVLTNEEARSLTANASPAEQRDRLAALLKDKGIISADELEAVRAKTGGMGPGLPVLNADYKAAATAKSAAPQPSPPTVNVAVA